jgi:putative flippase GtrA
MAAGMVSRVGDGLRALRARLEQAESRRFIRFAVVGGSGVFVNEGLAALGLTVLFVGVANHDLAKHLSVLLGIVVSIFTNFLLNDFWTWGDRTKHGARHWFSKLSRYYLVAGVAGGVQWAVAFSLHAWLDWHILATNAIGIGAAIAINYHVNNRWTFREVPRNDADRPE